MGQAEVFTQNKEYYKFLQDSKLEGGSFFYIRLLPHIKAFDVYACSTH